MTTPDHADDSRLIIATPDKRASAIIAQRIASEQRDAFVEWQRGIANAASVFPGYDRTEVFPPTDATSDEWVTIIHFQSAENLDHWLQSEARAHWNRKFSEEFGEFELRKIGTGLGLLFPTGQAPVERWKIVLVILLALYPLLLVLNRTLMVWLQAYPFPTKLLLSNLVCCSIMNWYLVPALTKMLAFWLHPADANRLRINILGATGIILVLVSLNFVFIHIP